MSFWLISSKLTIAHVLPWTLNNDILREQLLVYKDTLCRFPASLGESLGPRMQSFAGLGAQQTT